jgi:hypothetical protein
MPTSDPAREAAEDIWHEIFDRLDRSPVGVVQMEGIITRHYEPHMAALEVAIEALKYGARNIDNEYNCAETGQDPLDWHCDKLEDMQERLRAALTQIGELTDGKVS